MVSVFNLEELHLLLKDFYCITHLRITVFDRDCNELAAYPETCPQFCQLIHSAAGGYQACVRCDQEAFAAAGRQKKAYIYQCHAGLTEVVMPLWVGNVLAGYLVFGHIFAYEDDQIGWETVANCCTSYPIEAKKLRAALSDCPHVTREYLLAAAHILHATAAYLVLERMATLQEDSTAAKLDAYLAAHFTEPITAQSISQTLGISRSQLYNLSGELYGCGISEYIRNMRVNKAKQLLTDYPEMRISEIASDCGFPDYNYFITVFSKIVGTSPNAYRKQMI